MPSTLVYRPSLNRTKIIMANTIPLSQYTFLAVQYSLQAPYSLIARPSLLQQARRCSWPTTRCCAAAVAAVAVCDRLLQTLQQLTVCRSPTAPECAPITSGKTFARRRKRKTLQLQHADGRYSQYCCLSLLFATGNWHSARRAYGCFPRIEIKSMNCVPLNWTIYFWGFIVRL